jgi:ketosteroid isomerase-like protein
MQSLLAASCSDGTLIQVGSDLELVRSIYDAWTRGDYSSVGWADPDIEFSMVGSIDSQDVRGVAEMARAWGSFLSSWEGFAVECEEVLETEDGALVLTRFRGTGKRSGVWLDEWKGEDRARALADCGVEPGT